MAVKFENILKSFFPKGIIWIFQDSFKKLIKGMSIELNRAYVSATQFYDDFNIIESEALAHKHAADYLLNLSIYSNNQHQKIIVDYLNKDLNYVEILQNWADFLGVVIEFGTLPPSFIVGRSTTGNALGDPSVNNHRMTIYIKYISGFENNNDIKFEWLLEYFKPPYIYIIFSKIDINSDTPFYIGRNTTGNPLGIINSKENTWFDEDNIIWQDGNFQDWTLT